MIRPQTKTYFRVDWAYAPRTLADWREGEQFKTLAGAKSCRRSRAIKFRDWYNNGKYQYRIVKVTMKVEGVA